MTHTHAHTQTDTHTHTHIRTLSGFAGANTSPEALFKLKTAELKHGRLAMIGMLGVASQAAKNGEGALEALLGQ